MMPIRPDPDPQACPGYQINAYLRKLFYRTSTASFLSTRASIVSHHSPLWFHKLQRSGFDSNVDPDLNLMWIRIRNPALFYCPLSLKGTVTL
jgi:hypothetical protein